MTRTNATDARRRRESDVPRDLIITENITVDSVIDASGDWFVPAGAENAADVAEMRRVEERLRATADALLVGRATFESFRTTGRTRPTTRPASAST